MNKKISISLHVKITCLCVILILISSIGIGFFSVANARVAIEKSVGSSALNIIESIKDKINVEKFSSLKTEKDMDNPYYTELCNELNSIRQVVGLKYLYTMRRSDDGKYIYVADGSPLDSEDRSLLGDEELEMSKGQIASFDGQIGYELNQTEEWGNLTSAYIPLKNSSGVVVGVLAADFDSNEVMSQLKNLKNTIITTIIIFVIIGIILSEFITYFIIRSIKRLKGKVEQVKGGNLTVSIENNSSDEIGVLSQSFKIMIENIVTLTKDIRKNSKLVLSQILSLNNTFSQASSSNEEVNHAITAVAEGCIEQVIAINDVTSALDNIYKQVTVVVEHSNSVSTLSHEAMTNSEDAMLVFNSLTDKVNLVNSTIENAAKIVNNLKNKSDEISSFSETIFKIAKQTNLLALNAAIEAASAGEHGKGFSIVASEVKGLAEQSSLSSKQIKSIVDEMQKEISDTVYNIEESVIKAQEGVGAAEEVNKYLVNLKNLNIEVFSTIKSILESIKIVDEHCKNSSDNVLKIADVSRDLSAASQQAAASTEEQTAVIQQIESFIEDIRALTESLDKSVDRFKVE